MSDPVFGPDTIGANAGADELRAMLSRFPDPERGRRVIAARGAPSSAGAPTRSSLSRD